MDHKCETKGEDNGGRCVTCGEAVVYEWTVKIAVQANWVADGFDLTSGRLQDMLHKALPYARGSELGCAILESPNADEIAREMGYTSAEERAQRDTWYAIQRRIQVEEDARVQESIEDRQEERKGEPNA